MWNQEQHWKYTGTACRSNSKKTLNWDQNRISIVALSDRFPTTLTRLRISLSPLSQSEVMAKSRETYMIKGEDHDSSMTINCQQPSMLPATTEWMETSRSVARNVESRASVTVLSPWQQQKSLTPVSDRSCTNLARWNQSAIFLILKWIQSNKQQKHSIIEKNLLIVLSLGVLLETQKTHTPSSCWLCSCEIWGVGLMPGDWLFYPEVVTNYDVTSGLLDDAIRAAHGESYNIPGYLWWHHPYLSTRSG